MAISIWRRTSLSSPFGRLTSRTARASGIPPAVAWGGSAGTALGSGSASGTARAARPAWARSAWASVALVLPLLVGQAHRAVAPRLADPLAILGRDRHAAPEVESLDPVD